MTQTASCRYLVLEGAYLLGCIEGPCTPLQFLWAELTRLDVGLDHVLCDAFYGKHTVLKHNRPQHVHLKLSGSVLKLTDFQHGTAFGWIKQRAREESRLVLVFDVWRVCKLLSVRLGRTLGGRAASSAAPQQLQAAAVAGPLWGERQIEQQAVR